MHKYLFTIMFAVGLTAHSLASGTVPNKAQAKPVVPARPTAKVTAPKPAAPKQVPKFFQPTKNPAATAKKMPVKAAPKTAPTVALNHPKMKKPPRFTHKHQFHKHDSSSSSSSSSDCQHKPKDKWFIVMHENADASQVLSVPQYADFASRGTYFSNFFAITHPSQPNYIGLIAGDTFEPPFYDDAPVDFPNADHPEADSTIIDLIEEKGLSWKVYIENYPDGGTTDDFAFFVYSLGAPVWDFQVTSGPAAGDYPAAQASFGAQTGLPSATLIATPNLDGTPGMGQDFTGKIVIIPRGTFSSVSKAKNAQDAGAIGVIIYNSVSAPGLFTPGDLYAPSGVDPTVTIPVFGISHPAGLVIADGVTLDPTSTGELFEDLITSTFTSNAMYARKHNPFISFLNISTNPQRAAKLVNAEELAQDIANNRVPDFAFYIPNQFNDGHDTPIIQLDYTTPISQFVPYYSGQAFATSIELALANESFRKDRVVVLTFDEDDFADDVNKIYCAFVGENVKPNNVVNASYDLYSLLRTIEDSLTIGTLGRNDSTATPMTGWRK